MYMNVSNQPLPGNVLMKAFLHVQWAVVDVDADAAENADVKPELEPGEFIDVFLVPFQGLHKTLLVSQY